MAIWMVPPDIGQIQVAIAELHLVVPDTNKLLCGKIVEKDVFFAYFM